eukprot:TRINITY_DN5972_c0_g3_i3.p2 TRINITY_DN5972_c0_g3~~TRINITY_DN5972_c0_g3_i3.p2  ORF type:complete len:103 (-),score=50.55 TRINITY_DN5972_c0_g3_i3:2-310(-)
MREHNMADLIIDPKALISKTSFEQWQKNKRIVLSEEEEEEKDIAKRHRNDIPDSPHTPSCDEENTEDELNGIDIGEEEEEEEKKRKRRRRNGKRKRKRRNSI